MKVSWENWLNEPISINKGLLKNMKRKHAIYLFYIDGILPFITKAGYKCRHNTKQMVRLLLSALYFYSTDYPISFYKHDNVNIEEQYTEFMDVLDTLAWSRFWEKWGDLQDFAIDSPTYRFRFYLTPLLWSWIDLEESPRALRLEKYIEYSNAQDEATKGREDLYLQETAKHDFQDRHWH